MTGEEWIDSTLDLAVTYQDRQDGNRAENLETAIRLYESVLSVLPPRKRKDLRAAIENNLASAYTDRVQGDRGHNLERAIAGYRRALKLIGRDRDPMESEQFRCSLYRTPAR